MESRFLGNYKATVLFQNRNWSIEKYQHPNTKKQTIGIIHPNGISENVMIYDNKEIAFDNPYKIPEYIKSKIRFYARNIG